MSTQWIIQYKYDKGYIRRKNEVILVSTYGIKILNLRFYTRPMRKIKISKGVMREAQRRIKSGNRYLPSI